MDNKKIYFIASIIGVIAIINWGFYAFNYNLVEKVLDILKISNMKKIVYILIACVGIYLAMQRSTYLPFLGETVLPSAILTEKYDKNKKLTATIESSDGEYLIFWAAKKDDDLTKLAYVKDAYGDYKNSGVSKFVNGKAPVYLDEPQEYHVRGNKMTKHFHYRIVYSNGLTSEIKTHKL